MGNDAQRSRVDDWQTKGILRNRAFRRECRTVDFGRSPPRGSEEPRVALHVYGRVARRRRMRLIGLGWHLAGPLPWKYRPMIATGACVRSTAKHTRNGRVSSCMTMSRDTTDNNGSPEDRGNCFRRGYKAQPGTRTGTTVSHTGSPP